MYKRRIRSMGLGVASSGALFMVISLLIQDEHWFLLTGSMFALIGIILFFSSSWLAE